MDKIEITNNTINDILLEIQNNILSTSEEELYKTSYEARLGSDGKGYNNELEINSGTSKEYHRFLMELDKEGKHEGYPECSMLVDYIFNQKIQKENILNRNNIIKLCDKLNVELGAKNNSLVCYYPKDGYIGWHHNANAPGYNVLFTFNDSNGGYFEEYDIVNNKYIKHEDGVGWSAKTGYFGGHNEHNKKVWHCAANYSGRRITVSYIIDQYDMWMDMIDELGSN